MSPRYPFPCTMRGNWQIVDMLASKHQMRWLEMRVDVLSSVKRDRGEPQGEFAGVPIGWVGREMPPPSGIYRTQRDTTISYL